MLDKTHRFATSPAPVPLKRCPPEEWEGWGRSPQSPLLSSTTTTVGMYVFFVSIKIKLLIDIYSTTTTSLSYGAINNGGPTSRRYLQRQRQPHPLAYDCELGWDLLN